MEERYIENPFLRDSFNNNDYTFGSLYSKELYTLFSSSLVNYEQLLRNNQPNINDDDTIYTGITGLCFLYLIKYFKDEQKEQQSLDNCKELYYNIIKHIKKSKSKKRITFLSGQNGLLTIGIILNHIDNDANDFNELFNELANQCNEIINEQDKEYPFELLYGKCGYLQCFLLIKRHCCGLGNEIVFKLDKIIQSLLYDIVSNGRSFSEEIESESPLMYEWHGSKYLGGIHGLSGISYILISALEMVNIEPSEKVLIEKDISGSLEFLMSNVLPSGNFQSRPDNKNDRLVQFCHGAPGVIPTLIKAYSYFKDLKYLECAKSSSNVIWRYGLLTKGPGLCHGISGNAYSFLLIYKESKDLSFLYKSISFAKLLLTEPFYKQLHTPDNPYSLFEGIGGLVCLLNDLTNIYIFNNDNNYLKRINFPSL